ncbi:glycerate kinase [Candidatus Neomarinimicrobiota bacterium]
MKIVIAVDSFKDSMSAITATHAIAQGISRISPNMEIVSCPIADGGEGTIDTFLAAIDGLIQHDYVTGPLGELQKASWALFPEKKLAVIELAQAAGLQLVPEIKRNPLYTTTFGVGELIRSALDADVSRIIIGIGGSATNDGGAGLAQALGVQFDGIDSPITGGSLSNIKSIDMSSIDPRINTVQIDVACDVKNVLTGPEGAAHVYGTQKGASPKQIEILDTGLKHLASLMPEIDSNYPGAGAAGGVGWGLMAFCNVKLHKGIELILDALNFSEVIDDADLIITGEGRMDNQSLQWKAPFGVAEYAATKEVPVVAICGDHIIDQLSISKNGIQACYSICKDLNIPVKQAMQDGEKLLEELTVKVLPTFILQHC